MIQKLKVIERESRKDLEAAINQALVQYHIISCSIIRTIIQWEAWIIYEDKLLKGVQET